ncbi:MAG TPA: hypothetical protein VH231_06620 [Solirubrobacteraceae bacterium]|nr:hypothetical protein [Solirubrobacteraceae bacterium]
MAQIDADEIPSTGFAAAIEEVIAAGDATHAHVPWRWLYPDRDRYLAQWPWRPGYAIKAFRNEPPLPRFTTTAHDMINVLGPSRYLVEPIYHADLLVTSMAQCEAKCARYERARPGLLTEGQPLNEVHYLPEQRSGLRTDPVPAEGRAAIAAFFDRPSVPLQHRRARRGTLAHASAKELAHHHERADLPPEAYRALLRFLDDDTVVVCGDVRTFDLEVHNLGNVTWPGDWHAQPLVRVAHRWLDPDGVELPAEDSARNRLPGPIPSGGRRVVPCWLKGPTRTGRLTLELDLVHELQRSFGCAIRVPIDVVDSR